MIGEESTVSAEPTSTGHVRSQRHSATAGLAHSGGSTIDTKRPSDTVIRLCAAIKACLSASSRVEPTQADTFDTVTESRDAPYGPGNASARASIAPDSGHRRRTTRTEGDSTSS